MIQVTMWNKEDPDRKAVVPHEDVESAGAFLTGAIRAAIDNGGTLAVEVEAV